MKKQNHKTAGDARKELAANGYRPLHTLPGCAQLYKKAGDKRRFAVARERRQRSEVYSLEVIDGELPTVAFTIV